MNIKENVTLFVLYNKTYFIKRERSAATLDTNTTAGEDEFNGAVLSL